MDILFYCDAKLLEKWIDLVLRSLFKAKKSLQNDEDIALDWRLI